MISVKINNAPSVKRRLQQILNGIADTSVPNKQISIMLDRWVQKNFQSEGKLVDGWHPIEREGKILQDTGRLRLSFIPFSSRADAGIGSDLPYSKHHEYGEGVRERRMLPLLDDVKDDIIEKYNDHIKRVGR